MPENVREQAEIWAAECDAEVIFYDGLDDALVGLAERFNDIIAIYDRDKVIEILMRDGATREEAEEHFGFNVLGSYVGKGTPAFIVFKPEGR